MSLDKILFGIILAICVLLGALMLVPDAPDDHGVTHPDFPSMLHGGSGPARHAHLLWYGWVFGVLQISFFASLMAFGARKGQSLRRLGRPLLFGMAAHMAVWTLCVIAYRQYLSEPSHTLVLGLPVPTAIMLYGMWFTPAIYTFLFVLGFKRWYLTDKDLADFERLMKNKHASESG
jgi:hypothetical protein